MEEVDRTDFDDLEWINETRSDSAWFFFVIMNIFNIIDLYELW